LDEAVTGDDVSAGRDRDRDPHSRREAFDRFVAVVPGMAALPQTSA
jgi:hypothetical protein